MTARADTDGGRYGAHAGFGRRSIGLAPAILLHAIVLGALLIHWRAGSHRAVPSAPLVVDMLPLAAPPPQPVAEDIPQPVEERIAPPVPVQEQPLDRSRTPLPIPNPLPPPMPSPKPAEPPAPPKAANSAPPPPPAPPARKASGGAKDSWQGRVLARIEQHKRYPARARLQRVQGVVFVKFRMKRNGTLIWSNIQKSSGSAELDAAALATLRRAAPLPEIPEELADELELAVPIEFFIR